MEPELGTVARIEHRDKAVVAAGVLLAWERASRVAADHDAAGGRVDGDRGQVVAAGRTELVEPELGAPDVSACGAILFWGLRRPSPRGAPQQIRLELDSAKGSMGAKAT